MRLRKWMGFTTMALLLALPLQPAAQEKQDHKKEYPHYKLVDIGTFGGPNDIINGPNVPILSDGGTYGGESELNIPDPYAPNFCQNEDSFSMHRSGGTVS
jgi:hypothetical protein